MPDEIHARLRELERAVALAGQRAEDHEGDIRAFGPALVEIAEMKAEVRALRLMITTSMETASALATKVETSRKETVANRTLIRVAAIGLTGTFFTSTGAVVVAMITGTG